MRRIALLLLVTLLLVWVEVRSASQAPTASLPAPGAPAPHVAVAKGRVDVEGGVYKLAASRDGLIKEVFAEEGAEVERGQILARLNDEQARLALAQADAELAQTRAERPVLEVRLRATEREVRRLAPLASDGTVARRDLDQAQDDLQLVRTQIHQNEAAVEVALRRRAVAAYEVQQRAVRAPRAGRIVRRQARPGDGVSTLNVTPLFLFVPNTPRIVRAELDERFVDRVRPGMRAEITFEAGESPHFGGRVLRVGQVFGDKQLSGDPTEKVDVRVVDCVLSMEDQSLVIGQRVLVKIFPEPQP